jgi:hypothetical protein
MTNTPDASHSSPPADPALLDKVALAVPRILLPRNGVNLARWAVVACDQYTSQPDYWQDVDRLVGASPSTLRLTLPEVYLGQADTAARVAQINATMATYLAEGILEPQAPGFMLVDRTTQPSGTRRGLVVALDLERYDFRPGSQPLIRATEGTILDRLPPRIEIRQHAPIELPHIMVLIDDPAGTVIEPLATRDLPIAYETELMKGGGHIRGRAVRDAATIEAVARALAALATPEMMQQRYGTAEGGVFLYAMGDGNHSLATAKAIWESLKAEQGFDRVKDHPARHALVELVNVHDAGLHFEAIQRVVFDVEPQALLAAMDAYFGAGDRGYRRLPATSEAPREILGAGPHRFAYVCSGEWGTVELDRPPHTLPVGSLQAFLDSALPKLGGSIDYIHGDDVVRDLGARPRHVGFFVPPMPKHDLFKTVLRDGPLPRKAFSMGEAHEKRYYLEARSISGSSAKPRPPAAVGPAAGCTGGWRTAGAGAPAPGSGQAADRPRVPFGTRRSNRSRFMTLFQAATKSRTNFSRPSADAYTSAMARSCPCDPNTRSTAVAVHFTLPLPSRPS